MSDVQITQQELQEIYELDRDIAQRQERSAHLKSNVEALLMEKRPMEQGRFYARLIWRTFHHPAWKQVVIDHLGPDFAEKVRKEAPSNKVCEVMVEEHAVEPLWKGLQDTGSESQN